jgi:ribosomal protein L30/L7E
MATLLVIRLRGTVGVGKALEDTMNMLGLKRRYSAALLEATPVTIGMVRKIENFTAWGEAVPEIISALEKRLSKHGIAYSGGLKPPAGGLKSVKLNWPKGDLGHRGAAINELAKRMM